MQKEYQIKVFYWFLRFRLFLPTIVLIFTSSHKTIAQTNGVQKYYIDETSSYFVNPDTWEISPKGGDTIFISSERTKALRFQNLTGEQDHPIVIVNDGGQVNIQTDTLTWGAIVFENCRYIKITGEGDSQYRYGFKLAAGKCGLAFAELSSDCEASNIMISFDGFFGIMAKKDYDGVPPSPIPVFSNLIIHDCFIENVSEGMYLGETRSPGMEFKHVRVYNNIVRNTKREAIQVANMVEDIEIYNNTLLNAGTDHLDQQNNIIQIGDNSVANVHDNILIGAPGCGIISFGKGDNYYSRNFISSCKGIFIDNRNFTDVLAPIVISDNFFSNNINTGWIIRNMNEMNQLSISENLWDTDIDFYLNESGNNDNYELDNNLFSMISLLLFAKPEDAVFSKAGWNSSIYSDIGAPTFAEYTFYEKAGAYNEFHLPIENITSYENSLNTFNNSSHINFSVDELFHMKVFDLGQEYTLNKIAFHDMTNSNYLEMSSGEPDNWHFLFSNSYEKFNQWIEHDVNVKTRYVGLNTEMVLNASATDLFSDLTKSSSLNSLSTDLVLGSNLIINAIVDVKWERHPNVFLCSNVISDQLCINMADHLNQDFTIEIFNMNGAKLYQRNISYNGYSRIILDISDKPWKNGFYLMRYKSSDGATTSLKFMRWNN